MANAEYLSQFEEMAQRVGAEVCRFDSIDEASRYIASQASGKTLVPDTQLARKHNLTEALRNADVEVFEGNFREAGYVPGAGVTFCNFGFADTGTVVLESTAEEIRLATTLPEKHFVFVDPAKILEDNLAGVAPMTAIHQGSEPRFLAYITGPSRTADIERVLTIGCHGPRELHLMIVENLSDDLMEL